MNVKINMTSDGERYIRIKKENVGNRPFRYSTEEPRSNDVSYDIFCRIFECEEL